MTRTFLACSISSVVLAAAFLPSVQPSALPSAVGATQARGATADPTDRYAYEIYDGMPADIRALSDKLADPAGLGGKIAERLHTDPQGVLALLALELPGWSRHSILLQTSTASGTARSVAPFNASLASIEQGENAQGVVQGDSGWSDNVRTFTLVSQGVKTKLRQVRSGATVVRQKSTYRWKKWTRRGAGIDWTLAAVGADGQVKGYVVYSEYASNYGTPADDQRSAVEVWKSNTEGRSSGK